MKKIVAVVSGIILFAGLTTSVLAATQYPKIIVSQKTNTATSPSETIIPTPTPIEEYILPYPGMLQDNPLYFLKTIRDRIMEWLINDPIRKIDFYILESDKNLNAGILLNVANKKTFVLTTLTQSLADMRKAVSLASSLRGQGRPLSSDVIEHMSKSLVKHEEILTDFVNKAGEGERGNFETLVSEVKNLESEVAKLK